MRNQYEKQEKVLWYAQIMIFLGALATWFNHMDMHTFYTINIILSVISIISLTLDRFYFSEKIGQKVHNSYSVAYGLLVIFTLLLVILYAGILKIDLIIKHEKKMTDIAKMYGFSGSSYFSEMFKKTLGITPRAFYKSVLQQQTLSSNADPIHGRR